MSILSPLILAIDQGTTGTKSLLVNPEGNVVAQSYVKYTQYYPKSAWVEHDPEEIWQAVVHGVQEAMESARVKPEAIVGIGIANQGETVMWWDAESHSPLYPAVVWSCRRSQEIAENWEKDGDWNEYKLIIEKRIRQQTWRVKLVVNLHAILYTNIYFTPL